MLTFYEFNILNESTLLDKILTGLECEHVRFFENRIVYPEKTQNFTICIYCYSQKKNKQLVTLISNLRNYNDEENHEILSFCEKNELTLNLLDYENPFKDPFKEHSAKREKCLIVGDEIVEFESFFEVIEKKIFNDQRNTVDCLYCGFKMEPSFKKCTNCILIEKDTECPDKKMRKVKNYNFIEKLQIRKNLD